MYSRYEGVQGYEHKAKAGVDDDTVAHAGNVQGVGVLQGLHEQQGLAQGRQGIRPARQVAKHAAQLPQRLRQLPILPGLARLRLDRLRITVYHIVYLLQYTCTH